MLREFSATVVQRECQLRGVRSVARHAGEKAQVGRVDPIGDQVPSPSLRLRAR